MEENENASIVPNLRRERNEKDEVYPNYQPDSVCGYLLGANTHAGVCCRGIQPVHH